MNKVYSIVTDNIIAMLDKGVVPWRKPWAARGGSIPRNAWGRPYRGINIFILSTTAAFRGYTSSYWMTFKQVQERGGAVKKGEKSTLVVFWTLLDVKDETSKTGTKRVPILRYFLVFNLDQTEGVTLTKKQQGERDGATADTTPDFGGFDDAEAIIGTYLATDGAPKFREVIGDRAYFDPRSDAITVPDRSQYDNPAEYFSTTFHEFGHSTGHSSRLNREGVVNFDHFGSQQYADEELVAEMTSAFLCAEAGIDNTVENSAAYIAGWKKRLTDDPMLIIRAAGRAQKAADFILGTTFDKPEGDE